MKRGLKLSRVNQCPKTSSSPNPGPDEEGIETISSTEIYGTVIRPNPGPDEEGIETKRWLLKHSAESGPNPGPDEEGIETELEHSLAPF